MLKYILKMCLVIMAVGCLISCHDQSDDIPSDTKNQEYVYQTEFIPLTQELLQNDLQAGHIRFSTDIFRLDNYLTTFGSDTMIIPFEENDGSPSPNILINRLYLRSLSTGTEQIVMPPLEAFHARYYVAGINGHTAAYVVNRYVTFDANGMIQLSNYDMEKAVNIDYICARY